MLKYLAIPAALIFSFALQANSNVETWDFTRATQVNVGSGSSLTLTSTLGNAATMTAWSSSSTGEATQSSFYLNGWGTNVNGHGVDNFAGSQFILLEFAQPVELTSLVTSWRENSLNGNNWARFTVAGFDNNNAFTDSGTKQWLDIATEAAVKTAYWNGAWNNGTTNFADASYLPASNTHLAQGIAKTTWLIGAYNASFNPTPSETSGWDKLKFSSLTTSFNSAVTDVPAPATLALFGLGLLLLMRRRQSFVG